MVIKGKARGAAAQAAWYLTNKGKNENIRFIETKGTVSQDVQGAVQEMAAIAAISRCKKFLYHASINPKEGEHLTDEQWQQAVDALEKNLGLDDHQRIVVEHTKDGRTHRHILWNRVDQEAFKSVRMSHNYAKHERTARQLEKEFGFDHVQGVHVFEKGAEPGKEHGPSHNEGYQAKKEGINLRQWRKDIRELAAKGEGMTGSELVTLLEGQGYMVAQGDKVDFVILDPAGNPHRMAQSLGIKVKDLKERLADVGPMRTLEEAQQKQKEVLARRAQEKEILKARKARKDLGMYSSGSMASQQMDALRHVRDRAKLREKAQKAQEEQLKRIQREEEEKKQKAREEKIQKPKTANRPTQEQASREEKAARTEQTDAKQKQNVFRRLKDDTDYSKYTRQNNNGREPGGGGRERER
jgi:hypothetical protein